MLKKSFFKTIPFFLFIVLLNSCDKEYNVIGEELIGDNTFDLAKFEPTVVAYNQKIGAIQSNNLEINALGIYDNPSFGTTTANFNAQLALAVENPTIDVATAKIKSVVLTIPYFYDKTKTVTNTDGSHVYVLDSIYGPENAKIKLNIYRSGYYMRSLDPADQFLSPQKYYTNQNSVFYDAKIGTPLNNDSSPAQNSEFIFSPAEYSVETTNSSGVKTTTLKPPAMHLNLDNQFFQDNILNAPAGSLTTNDLFKDYFRGLYFNVESSGSNPGNLNMINFKTGNIVITYEETVVTSGVSAQVEKTMILNISGNTVSLLNQSNPNANYEYATNPANINAVAGDVDLYLKGGEGSMAIMDLFGGGELEMMRANKYLINQASLTFFVNSSAMGSSYVPQRIYLYNFTKNTPVYDYGGVLSTATAANGGGLYYKLIITNYVRNLIKNTESTNDKLGLVVSEKINSNTFYALQVPNTDPAFAFVPMTSVMNPLGVILYGSNASVPVGKRAKLEIYYTKPN